MMVMSSMIPTLVLWSMSLSLCVHMLKGLDAVGKGLQAYKQVEFQARSCSERLARLYNLLDARRWIAQELQSVGELAPVLSCSCEFLETHAETSLEMFARMPGLKGVVVWEENEDFDGSWPNWVARVERCQ